MLGYVKELCQTWTFSPDSLSVRTLCTALHSLLNALFYYNPPHWGTLWGGELYVEIIFGGHKFSGIFLCFPCTIHLRCYQVALLSSWNMQPPHSLVQACNIIPIQYNLLFCCVLGLKTEYQLISVCPPYQISVLNSPLHKVPQWGDCM